MSTALVVTGIILLAIGIIMIIIGIVVYEQNVSRTPPTQPWYVWLLIIGGAILAIIGGAVLAWGLINKANMDAGTVTTTTYKELPTQVCQPTSTPKCHTHKVVTGHVHPNGDGTSHFDADGSENGGLMTHTN